MKYRELGKTGLKVSEIGMGTWQLANDPGMWVGSDSKESLKSLYEYVEWGGNFIDSAWIYGYDDKYPNRHPSEELIGKYLKQSGRRDELIIASKVPPKNYKWPAWKEVSVNKVFPQRWVEKCVEDSLRSFDVDTIDLMQFHVWQDDFVKDDGWKKVVEKTVKAGKVRHWGISINDYQPSNCLRTLDTGLISTIQFIFNVFHQMPTEKLLPYAKNNNIGLIARVPLDEAGLTGKIDLNTKIAKGDFRRSYFKGKRRKELVERLTKLRNVSEEETDDLVELALRYLLSFDEVSTIIPGMRKVEHVKSNMEVSRKGKLSAKLMNGLKLHSWERNFYYPDSYDPSMKDTGYIEK